MREPSIGEIMQIIEDSATVEGIPEPILHALVHTESSFKVWSTRYEPMFSKHHVVEGLLLDTTQRTEAEHQKTSWGLCQIMGYTARRIGWRDPIPRILMPEINIRLACNYLNDLHADARGRGTWRWALNAYNHSEKWLEINPEWARVGYIEHYAEALATVGEA